MEVFWRAGTNQSFPHVRVPDQPRDSAENFHVLSGGSFGTDDQKEKADRLAIQSVERNRSGGNACDHTERSHRGCLAVRYGNAESDARAELLLPTCDRPIGVFVTPTGAVNQPLHQLPDGPGFVRRRHRHHHALGRHQLAQEHGGAGRRMGSNVTVLKKRRKRFRGLGLANWTVTRL